ncbi:MAG: hypothetical protein QOH17_3310 [Pseudonocardiales bacterium]|nr:hypothetical protein [Pseudonocardiales bacterium]
MRSGRGLRNEYSAFFAVAYPALVAQMLAITGDARVARAAADSTLAKAWRCWASVRKAADPLVEARWMAVVAAADRKAQARPVAVGGITGESAVLVTALQLLPPVQRRALVLHYMAGVPVTDLAALSGSSAEHIETVLDEGFTTLADTLDWDHAHPPQSNPDGVPTADPANHDDEVDLRFDWTAAALADAAARLPQQITAPSPASTLRRAAVARWSAQVIPVGVGVASVVVAAVILAAQPGTPSEPGMPTIYAQNGNAIGPPAPPTEPAPPSAAGARPVPRIAPVGLRSVALTSLLDPSVHTASSLSASSGSRRPAARVVSSSSGSSSSGSRSAVAGSEPVGSSSSATTSPTAGSSTSTTATSSPPVVVTTTPPITTTDPTTTTTTPPPVTTDPPTTTTPPPVTTTPTTTTPTTVETTTTEVTTTTTTASSEETTSADETTSAEKTTTEHSDADTTDGTKAKADD